MVLQQAHLYGGGGLGLPGQSPPGGCGAPWTCVPGAGGAPWPTHPHALAAPWLPAQLLPEKPRTTLVSQALRLGDGQQTNQQAAIDEGASTASI